MTLHCYLLRSDGEWYDLGHAHRWRTSFAVFPGPPDGSVTLGPDDVVLLGLRLDDYEHALEERQRIAADIVRWADGQSFRFVSELEPEITPGVIPEPMTGGVGEVLGGGR